nr:putative reverse transcriptase domain-containing protein [Tanacetum cinerariifolium]
VHNTFHVSNLKKFHTNEPLVVSLDGLHFDDKLQFIEEPVKIMDREVKQLRQSRVPIVKVRWNSKRGHVFTWEREDQFRKKYPHLFIKTAPFVDPENPNHVYKLKKALYGLKQALRAWETCDLVDNLMVEKSKLDEDPQGKVIDPTRYHGMIGTLMYLTYSRPDLVFAMCMCTRDTPIVSVLKKKAPATTDRSKGTDLLSETVLLEDAQIKKVLKQSKRETHSHQASGSVDEVFSQPKVLDELQDKTTSINEATGTIPRILDVPKDQSTSENESWGESRDDDDSNDDVSDDDGNDDDNDDGYNDASDDERTKSDEDANLNRNQNDDDKEEEYKDERETQAEKKRYIDLIEKSVNDIINNEVKTQLPQILPKAVYDFVTLVIKSTITESLEDIQINKMEKSQLNLIADEYKELYKALVNSYNVEKDLFLVYVKAVSLKRGRGDKDKDKDKDPPAGSDQGMKKISKDAKSKKGSKSKICPKLPNKDFVEPPSNEEMVPFIKDLGEATPKKERKFMKVASLSKKQTIVLKEEPTKKPKWAKHLEPAKKSTHAKKEAPATTDRSKGTDLLSETVLLEDAQIKKVLKQSKRETHSHQASGSVDEVFSQPKVLDELQDKTTSINEATGTIPRILDVPKDQSTSENESWGESRDDDDSNDDVSDDDEEEYKDEYVHTLIIYEFNDDENKHVNEEEYDLIDEELYKDVNVKLKDLEHGEEWK